MGVRLATIDCLCRGRRSPGSAARGCGRGDEESDNQLPFDEVRRAPVGQTPGHLRSGHTTTPLNIAKATPLWDHARLHLLAGDEVDELLHPAEERRLQVSEVPHRVEDTVPAGRDVG